MSRRIIRAPVADSSWKGDSPDWMFAPIFPGECGPRPPDPTVEYLRKYKADVESRLVASPEDAGLLRELEETTKALGECEGQR